MVADVLGRRSRVDGDQRHRLAVLGRAATTGGDHLGHVGLGLDRGGQLSSAWVSAGPGSGVTSSSGPLKPGPNPLASRS